MFCLKLAPIVFNQGYPYDQHIHLKRISEIHQREVSSGVRPCAGDYTKGYRCLVTHWEPNSLRQNFIFLSISLFEDFSLKALACSPSSVISNLTAFFIHQMSNFQVKHFSLKFIFKESRWSLETQRDISHCTASSFLSQGWLLFRPYSFPMFGPEDTGSVEEGYAFLPSMVNSCKIWQRKKILPKIQRVFP